MLKTNKSHRMILDVIRDDKEYTLKQIQDLVYSEYQLSGPERRKFRNSAKYIAEKLARSRKAPWSGREWRAMVLSTGTYRASQIPETDPKPTSLDSSCSADQARGKKENMEERQNDKPSRSRALRVSLVALTGFAASIIFTVTGFYTEWFGIVNVMDTKGASAVISHNGEAYTSPSFDGQLGNAWAHLRAGKIGLASILWENMLSPDSNLESGKYWHLKGLIEAAQGDDPLPAYDRSIDHYNKASTPKNVFIVRSLKTIWLSENGMPEIAMEQLRNLKEPSSPGYKGLYFYSFMIYHHSIGQLKNALLFADKSLKCYMEAGNNSRKADLLIWKADILIRLGSDAGKDATLQAQELSVTLMNQNKFFLNYLNFILLAKANDQDFSVYKDSIFRFAAQNENRYMIERLRETVAFDVEKFGDDLPTDDDGLPESFGDDLPTDDQGDPSTLKPEPEPGPKKIENPEAEKRYDLIRKSFREGTRPWEKIRGDAIELKAFAPEYTDKAHWYIGQCEKKIGQYVNALNYFESLEGSENASLRFMSTAERARILLRINRLDDARDRIDSARTIGEQWEGMTANHKSWLDHIEFLILRETNISTALESAQAAIEQADNDARLADALLNRGSLLIIRGEVEDGLRDTVEAMGLAGKEGHLNKLYYGYINLAAVEHARRGSPKVYEKAVRRHARTKNDQDIITELEWMKKRIGF